MFQLLQINRVKSQHLDVHFSPELPPSSATFAGLHAMPSHLELRHFTSCKGLGTDLQTGALFRDTLPVYSGSPLEKKRGDLHVAVRDSYRTRACAFHIAA